MSKYAITFVAQADLPAAIHGALAELQAAATAYAHTETNNRAQVETTFNGAITAAAGNAGAINTAVRAYEVSYRNCGKNHTQLIGRLKAALTNPRHKIRLTGAANEGVINLETYPPAADPAAGGGWAAMASSAKPAAQSSHVVGHIRLGNARFEPFPGPAGSHHAQLFRHRESNLHYIKDRTEQVVRRFVKRAINEHDFARLGEGQTLRAHIHPAHADANRKTAKETDEFPHHPFNPQNKVLFHLQKGSNRFNSTSTTKHKVFSNTGEEFTDADYGYIIVDLAYVPKDRILDVHTEPGIKGAIGVSDGDFTAAFTAGRDYQPQQRAVRDVVRTREVLIESWIPYGAIVYTSHDASWINDADTYDPATKDCIETQFPGHRPPDAG